MYEEEVDKECTIITNMIETKKIAYLKQLKDKYVGHPKKSRNDTFKLLLINCSNEMLE